MYKYRLFGLKLISEIKIVALECLKLDSNDNFDVKIFIGNIPKVVREKVVSRNGYYSISKNEFTFKHILLDVGFHVRDDNEIIIDKACCNDLKVISIYLLGTIMGYILYKKNYLPLHASAIHTSKGAVLFLGESGVGKSTTAFKLCAKGYELITDDIAPIKVIDGEPVVYAGYPKFKLDRNTLQTQKIREKKLKILKEPFNKYYVNSDNKVNNEFESIHKIYNLSADKNATLTSITPHTGLDKLKLLKLNTYRKIFIKHMNKRTKLFKIEMKLSELPICSVNRTNKLKNINEFIDKIEEDMSR
ncbi:MAG: hypothetical protein GY750_04965 [Lentisphaerae bacterium]|nr:hypothetical protein [Lentisphaerota bacterium]